MYIVYRGKIVNYMAFSAPPLDPQRAGIYDLYKMCVRCI